MATPGDLLKVVAATTGVSHSSVDQIDRHLGKAGLRTKAGRGRGAAQVTAKDAARLLTAVMAAARPTDAVADVSRYEATVHDDYSEHPIPRMDGTFLAPAERHPFLRYSVAELRTLPNNHSFVEAVAALLEAVAAGRFEHFYRGSMEIEVASPLTEGHIKIRKPFGRDRHKLVRYCPPGDPHFPISWDLGLVRTSRIGFRAPQYLGALLADRLDSLPSLPGMQR